MSMLPRLKPQQYYDLVVEVAIVRPGPIQGGMVHPYLKNRATSRRRSTIPRRSSKTILKRTLGVPLFQEQAMQIAIVAAGFAPAEADKLRRAMATFRRTGTIHKLKEDFIDGMIANNYEKEFAERCFKQIEGFGEYGFPESHAASFAHPGLCLVLGEMPLPRGLRRRPAQRPADGLLCAGADRARCARARRRGAAARRQCQRLGLHAGADRGPTLRPAPGLPPGDRARRRRHEAHGRARAPRPIAIRPTCGGAAASPSGRSWRSPAPTPSPRWACRAATCCGRCAAFSEASLPLLDARPRCAIPSRRSPCPG